MSGQQWVPAADRRVGVLGGTFDPVHYGHLVIAEQVREALELDRVLFVPAARPPHKLAGVLSPATDRAAMVELAIAGNPCFSMCRIELQRRGRSYTSDTMRALADEAALAGIGREFYFILSSEAFAALRTWHDPAGLLSVCRLAVVPRPGAPLLDDDWLEERLPPGAGLDRVACVQTVPLAQSSSDVRERAAAGRSIRYLVPPGVESYIREHGLYRASPALEERLT